MANKKIIYRSLRRLLAELREKGYELRDYFEQTSVCVDSYIGKYIENLRDFLEVKVDDNGRYILLDESIDNCGDLLKVVQNSGFNDKLTCLYYDLNILGKDSIYTLIYHDSVDTSNSRLDTFVINTKRN